MNWYNKRYYVYGLGISGAAVLAFLRKHGCSFVAYDDNPKNIESMQEEYSSCFIPLEQIDWREIDVVILSPGIQILPGKEHEVYVKARKYNKDVMSDLDLFYLANPEATYIAITGTNGKSTITSLLGHIFHHCGLRSHIGGNIGIPITSLPQEKNTFYILETSSFQLEISHHIRFAASVLSNLTPDHLDRHGDMNRYLAAKCKAFTLQSPQGVKFYSIDYAYDIDMHTTFPGIRSVSTKNLADFYAIDRMLYDAVNDMVLSCENTIALQGKHNMENILFAYAVAKHFQLPISKILQAIETFPGLEHRMQILAQKGNMRFINDSKATNADAAAKSLDSFDNIIWIAGGVMKEGGIESLKAYRHKIAKVLLIGQCQKEFAKTLEEWRIPYAIVSTLDNAMQILASNDWQPNNALHYNVLLAPAAASTDQFRNFEHRGQAFAAMIEQYFQ